MSHGEGAKRTEKNGRICYNYEIRRVRWYRGEGIKVKKRLQGVKGRSSIVVEEEYKVVQCCRDHVVVTNGIYATSFRKADLLLGLPVEESF